MLALMIKLISHITWLSAIFVWFFWNRANSPPPSPRHTHSGRTRRRR